MPQYGGQSSEVSGPQGRRFVKGPPELLAEIASSARALDLNQKRKDYRFAGGQEYLVVCVEERELVWFSFASKRRLHPDANGVYRSRTFPGLWIDGPALLCLDSKRLAEVGELGLASAEHAAFVARLRPTP